MNLTLRKTALIFIILVIMFPSVMFARNIGEFPDEKQWFSFAVEQNGKPIPVKNNRVELAKAPFTLVLILRGPIGVLVNFSEAPTLFKGFLKNKPLGRFLEQPDLFMGMGEEEGNPYEMIIIDDLSPHFIYYSDGGDHRFSSVEEQDGYIIGRRVISNYTTFTDEFMPYPIEILMPDTLYLSMLYGEWDENYNRIELQKEALKLVFK